MIVYLTQKINTSKQPLQGMLLALLMLCLIISCPIKRELKSALAQNTPVENTSSSQKQANTINYSLEQAGSEKCNTALHGSLEEIDLGTFFQNLDLKNPFLVLVATLASVYLFLLSNKNKSLLHPAFSGNVLAKDIPLFLRLRKLLI